jgi:hypothetical protein
MPARKRPSGGALRPVPLNRARFTGGFWGPRLRTNRESTLPLQYERLKETGRIDAFRLDWEPGKPNPPHQFWDSDVAKWLEAVARALQSEPDAALREMADEVASLIAGAQQDDGYLNVHYTVVEPEARWSNLRDGHELYCAGHLMEAAAALHRATGKPRLLNALRRYADHIDSRFGPEPDKRSGYSGHPEIETALVALYRETGEARYLDLAKYFVEERGAQPHYFDREAAERGEDPQEWWAGDYAYCQAHLPVREQRHAVGHSVRAMYLYCGMADVAAETGDVRLLDACRRLWTSATERRMYVTGGLGSTRDGERFTFDWDLPNETAYAETCAAIGLVFFAHRMLQIERDGRYADVMERALHNGALSGISLDGRRYFYENPLAVHPGAVGHRGLNRGAGEVGRQEWFGCACCPPNIARLLASLPRYAYSEEDGQAWVHLYAAGEAALDLGAAETTLRVATEYPRKESVRISVSVQGPCEFSLNLRMPGWCRDPELDVNGERVDLESSVERGYAKLSRIWQDGDEVELRLPMPVERIEANPNVRMDGGKVALQRGPIVYCLEETDNGPNLQDVRLPRDAALSAEQRSDLLGGVAVVTGRALRRDPGGWDDELYRPASSELQEFEFTAVPYYAWCNREPGEMTVWIRES